MRRNPGVYVKSRIRHANHATTTLRQWHRVLLNTEGESKAMKPAISSGWVSENFSLS